MGSGPPLTRESDAYRSQRMYGMAAVPLSSGSLGLGGGMSVQRPPILASVQGAPMGMQHGNMVPGGGGNSTNVAFWSCRMCGQRNPIHARLCGGCGRI